MGKRRRDESSSDSSSTSGGDSEARDDERRGKHRDGSDSDGSRRRKEKHSSKKDKRSRRHERDSKKEKSRGKEKKAKRSKDKRHKKEKKGKDKHQGGSSSGAGNLMGSWGKYGIIKDDRPDLSRYEDEFQAWMSDVKGIGAAGLPRWELEEHWKTFVEDFNTGTLPDKKYYDLKKWMVKEAERRKATGEDERTTFDDEEALRRERAEAARRREQEVSRDTLLRMGAANTIEDMRAQEMARPEMQHAWRTGDNAKAEELLKKFAPETNDEKWRQLKAEARALGRG